jgi:hypothetical protein
MDTIIAAPPQLTLGGLHRMDTADTLGRMIGQAGEDVGEPGTGVDVVKFGGLDQGVDGGGSLGTDIRRDLIVPGV